MATIKKSIKIPHFETPEERNKWFKKLGWSNFNKNFDGFYEPGARVLIVNNKAIVIISKKRFTHNDRIYNISFVEKINPEERETAKREFGIEHVSRPEFLASYKSRERKIKEMLKTGKVYW